MLRESSGVTGKTASVVLGLVLTLGACGRGAGESERTVRIGQDSDILSRDPSYPEVATYSALSNVFEPLVGYDAHLSIVPVLAVSWRTPDPQRWLFEIRGGVRFHDGSPLDAHAVATALERLRSDPESGVRAQLWAVEKAAAVGELQLEIRTREPDALLLHELTRVLVAARDAGGRFIGTGPYRVVRWDRGRVLRVEAVPGYWGVPPAIRSAEFVPVPEGEESLAALREGRVDLAEIPPVTDPAATRGLSVVASPGLTTYFLAVSSGPGPDGGPTPFADRRVRQALSLALYRRALAARVTGDADCAAEQVVPSSIFGHEPGLTALPFDPDRARRLLAEAGVSQRIPLTIAYRDAPVQTAIARELVAPLSALGCDVSLRPVPWKELVDGIREGRFPATLWSWDYDNADAGSFLRDLVHTRDESRGLGTFNPGFSSGEADRLIAEATAAFEPSARREIFGRVMRLVGEECPLIPLFHPRHVYGFSPALRFRPRLDDRFLVSEMAWEEKRGSR